MDFLTTQRFESKQHPEIWFIFRMPTIGRRMEFLRARDQAGDDLEWRKVARALWNVMIKDFGGITTDGAKPTIDDLFLEGPEDLVLEVSSELTRLCNPLKETDEADEAIIDRARLQIKEAEERMAARKNLGPQSYSQAGIPIAAPAPEAAMKPEESEQNEIALGIPV
jgi:hypothetical protein